MPDQNAPSCEATVVVDEHDDKYLQVNVRAPIVEATPWLNWNKTDEHASVPLFICKCILLSHQGLDTTSINVLDLNPTDDKWASLIDDLTDKGAFEAPIEKGEFMTILKDTHPLLEADNQALYPEDIRNPEEPEEEQEGEQEGSDSLRLITMATCASLIATHERPMHNICRLIGMLGP